MNGNDNIQKENVSKEMPNVQRIKSELSDNLVVSVERANNKSGVVGLQEVCSERKRIKEPS